MNKLSIIGKIGFAIEIIAGLIMVILVLFDQPIPDVVSWIYFVGVVIAFGGLFTNRKSKQ